MAGADRIVSLALRPGRILIRASWVLPVTAPPVPDGAVLVHDGRIVRVGAADALADDPALEETIDLAGSAILPGPVNAHVHLEAGWALGAMPRERGMAAWVESFVAAREDPPLEEARAALAGVRDCARFGTAAVGDVANTLAALAAHQESDLHAVFFREIFATEPERADAALTEGWNDALAASRVAPRIQGSVTAHAPHTSSEVLLRGLARTAREADLPVSIHCAESADEVRLLRDGEGPFADLLRRRERPLPPCGTTPLGRLESAGLVGPRTLLVHGVHLTDDEIARAAAAGCTVVTCPRSNAYIGVGTAPVPRFLAAGLPVALGTDSLASNDDLDMFAEVAALRREHPGLAPAAVLRMATLSGAEALGLDDVVGSLRPAREAFLVAVPVADGDDPEDAATRLPHVRTVIRPTIARSPGPS